MGGSEDQAGLCQVQVCNPLNNSLEQPSSTKREERTSHKCALERSTRHYLNPRPWARTDTECTCGPLFKIGLKAFCSKSCLLPGDSGCYDKVFITVLIDFLPSFLECFSAGSMSSAISVQSSCLRFPARYILLSVMGFDAWGSLLGARM